MGTENRLPTTGRAGHLAISATLAALLSAGCGLDGDPAEVHTDSRPPAEATRYIVVLDDSVGPDDVIGRARAIVGDIGTSAPSLALDKLRRTREAGDVNPAVYDDFIFRRVFPGFVIALDDDDQAAVEELRAHPDVLSVSLDRDVHALSQSSEPGMRRIRVQNNATARINGIDDVRVDADIAIIDSGIDPDHSDLNVFHSVSLRDDDPTLGDPNGHGTHVAGIAAAIDNDVGVHGVAPGARLWSIKIINSSGSTTDSLIAAGLEYALEHADEIDVVNMSLAGFGGTPDDRACGRASRDPIHLAVCAVVESGVVVVVAAGNGLPFFGDPAPASMFYPARYEEVITVSAITERDGVGPGDAIDPPAGEDRLWSKSNFGYDVDIAAPGVDVVSTLPGDSYGEMTGTSMAAPHVAGAAALWIVENGKPRNKVEVRAVRDELVRIGFPQNGSDNGFSDRETYGEPLLDVAPINRKGGDPIEPLLFTDSYYYDHQQSCAATVIVDVQDLQGAAIDGLPSNAFIPHIRGKQVPAGFRALGRGQYLLTLDISELPPNRHDLHVIVKDGSGFSRTAGAEIVVRTREPSLVIQSLHPHAPIIAPGTSSQAFLAAVTFGDGRPAFFSNGATPSFDSSYSGSGSVIFGFYFPGLAYGIYSATTSAANLALGVYTLQLTATVGDLSATAKTKFEVASPEPAVIASTTANTQVFDFSQTIAPQELVVDVSVLHEFLQPIVGLGSDAIAVFIDNQPVAGVTFAEEPAYSGNYRSAGIDLGGLSEGDHTVSVRVTDDRGLVADSKAFQVEVIKTAGPKPPPLVVIRGCE